MEMDWNQARDEAKKSDGGIFMTPRGDGETVMGIVVGRPFVYERTFQGDKDKPRKRWLVNFVRVPDGAVGVVELSNRTFLQQNEALAKYVQRAVVIIKCIGGKGDPKKTLMVMHERECTDADLKLWKDAILHDLNKVAASAAEFENKGGEDGKIPF